MPVPSWSTSVRLVALLLVLMAGVEVFACDLVSPGFCKVSSTTAGSGQTSNPSSSDDNCLCCCLHYVAPPPMMLTVLGIVGTTVAVPARSLPVSPSFIVYHPPRS